jgi:hypothetical protein
MLRSNFDEWQPDLIPYAILMQAFVDDRLYALEFESLYLTLFKNDPLMRLGAVFGILDHLFADVDAFCADEHLRDEDDLNEKELKDRVRRALGELRQLGRKDS